MWIKGGVDGQDIGGGTKALSGSLTGGAPPLLEPAGKTRTEGQKSVTKTYLVILETGLSFDLQSAGDASSAAGTQSKTTQTAFGENWVTFTFGNEGSGVKPGGSGDALLGFDPPGSGVRLGGLLGTGTGPDSSRFGFCRSARSEGSTLSLTFPPTPSAFGVST